MVKIFTNEYECLVMFVYTSFIHSEHGRQLSNCNRTAQTMLCIVSSAF